MFVSIGNRLREERERLGFSQSSFAEITGAHRKSQGNYELGERMPDAAYLAAIAAAGADVLYILTGQRAEQHTASSAVAAMNQSKSVAAYQATESATVYQPPESVTAYLSREEAALLDNYRNSPPEGQAAIKTTSAAFAKSKGVKKRAT
jgi:transcriptional regulator with XRE-family HTH domain